MGTLYVQTEKIEGFGSWNNLFDCVSFKFSSIRFCILYIFFRRMSNLVISSTCPFDYYPRIHLKRNAEHKRHCRASTFGMITFSGRYIPHIIKNNGRKIWLSFISNFVNWTTFWRTKVVTILNVANWILSLAST